MSGPLARGGSSATITRVLPRLNGLTLTLVADANATWRFNETRSSITSTNGALPVTIWQEFGLDLAPLEITSSWDLIDGNRQVRLDDFMVDGVAIELEVVLPITVHTTNRIDIGDNQYILSLTKTSTGD